MNILAISHASFGFSLCVLITIGIWLLNFWMFLKNKRERRRREQDRESYEEPFSSYYSLDEINNILHVGFNTVPPIKRKKDHPLTKIFKEEMPTKV